MDGRGEFLIRAMNPAGRVVEFTLTAPSAEAARHQAREAGLRLVVATAVPSSSPMAFPTKPAREDAPGPPDSSPIRVVVEQPRLT